MRDLAILRKLRNVQVTSVGSEGIFRYSSVLWKEMWSGECPQAGLATLCHGRSPQKETEHEKAQNHRTYLAGWCDSGSRPPRRRRRLPTWWMDRAASRCRRGRGDPRGAYQGLR